MLEGERELLPRPRFYSRCLDASSVSLEYVDFILRHLVQQRHQELQQEKLEKEREESERRRQSELPIDIRNKPKRLIPVDPIISPFDSGKDKVPGEGAYRSTDHPFSPVTDLESPSSPLGPGYPIPHKELTDSEDSIDSETESIMTSTTKELIDTLTKTLKNINQSPTIPLPVFKGKKREDPEDHILKVEDYFGVHQITEQADKISRFKDTLFETARKLSRKERTRLMKMLIKYRDAFSLRDEIGECPNLKADIKVIDDSPFFVRPFPISENDKPFMDDQMERLVSLGILSKNSTSHTSPVMLITRKLTKDKRPVVDFRLLNTRILRRNTSIPLMSDVLSILGNSECEVVSCVDIKDAYHSIRLTEMSKEYCGILPYFGSPMYRYEVLPVGIACAPQIWMDYITLILNELENKKKYISIMDDLLIHSTKADHWKLLEQLLKSMCKNGLRLSPKKCQLFKTNLIYMGNEFAITKRTMTITPLRSVFVTEQNALGKRSS